MSQQLHYVNDEWKVVSEMSLEEIKEALEFHRSLLRRLNRNKERIEPIAEKMIQGLLRRMVNLEDAFRNLSNQYQDSG